MFKKLFVIFIVLVILSVGCPAGSAMAAEEAAPNKVLTACKEKRDAYKKFVGREKSEDAIDPSVLTLEKPYDLNFRLKFEKARTYYHDFVKCVFDQSAAEILGSAAGDTEGIWTANSPNLAEWMKPEVACLSEEKLAEILKSAGPQGLLKPLLLAHSQYVEYLRAIYNQASVSPTVDEAARDQFWLIVDRNEFFKQLVENEAKDSIVALDAAFNGLKELRQAFTIHVRFQCMLRNLDHYRRALENLRSVMWVIPSLIEDASKD